MNKQDLVNAVAVSMGVPEHLARGNASAAVNVVFDRIEAALARGEDVKISGFGTFRRITTKARTGHNPRTGEPVEIPARNKAKFKASSKLKV